MTDLVQHPMFLNNYDNTSFVQLTMCMFIFEAVPIANKKELKNFY